MSKGGLGGGADMEAEEPDAEEPDMDDDKAYRDICGDAFDAMKKGSKEEFCNYMLELLERHSAKE
jgi:hypothetical protein